MLQVPKPNFNLDRAVACAAVEAMRSDPRMKAYFSKIIELASLDSIVARRC
jgi:hypothetical protein